MSLARGLAGGAALTLALALGGCGEGRSSDDDGPLEDDPSATEIVGTEYRLDPAIARRATAGAVVLRFVNEGRQPHALAVDGPQGETRTRAVKPGATATLRLALPEGTYRLTCPLHDHAARGMVGRLRIAE